MSGRKGLIFKNDQTLINILKASAAFRVLMA